MGINLPADNIQSTFLEEVRKKIPGNISFADELAELLGISRDSVYRRIRGETVLSLDEVKKICNYYKLSLDDLLSPSTEMVAFHHRSIDHQHFTFEMWLQSILNNLEMISLFPHKEIIYAAKDIPPFYYFQFPFLAEFKMFFWMKTYHRYPQFATRLFDSKLISENLLDIGKRIWKNYALIPSTEIWSEETFHVTLRQIEFYHETGVISPAQTILLCDDYLNLTDHILQFAKSGNKGSPEGKFNFYKNDILIPETTIFFKMGDKRVSFITYSTMNLLTTSQESFCKQTEDYLINVVNNSELLSTTGEKERTKFFNNMQHFILAFKKKVTLS